MYLLTEADDNIVTENGNLIVADSFETCGWPTLDEVMIELQTSDDAYVQRQINATISSIENYIGRKLARQVDEEIFHLTPCDTSIGAQSKLQLHRWPIVEVISCIALNDPTRTINYTIDEHGILCGDFQLHNDIKVNYYGGLECPLPDDLIDVFYQIVNARYSARSSSGVTGEIKSESIPGVIKVDYFQDASSVSSASSDPVTYKNTLDFYKSYYV